MTSKANLAELVFFYANKKADSQLRPSAHIYSIIVAAIVGNPNSSFLSYVP